MDLFQKTFSELFSIDIALLFFLLVTGLLAIIGIDRRIKALILPFLISAVRKT